MKLVACLLLGLLVSGVTGCADHPAGPPPRYVWYCHIAGGSGCIGEMIRCWDRQGQGWVADSFCAAFAKPANLVHNQSYPPVSRSALMPGR